MNKQLSRIVLSLALFFWAAGAATTAQAQGSDGIELRTTAEVEIEVTNEDGVIEVQRKTAGKVVPGDEVIYTMFYHNAGQEEAEDVVITNPLPEHMLLLRTDALGRGQELIFSVNGGQDFDALAQLHVTDENGRRRPATASDCTHLRWVFNEPLGPGEEGHVSYTAQLQ